MRINPIAAYSSISHLEAENLLIVKKITCLPLVDQANNLITVLVSKSLHSNSQSHETAVIMAGVKGPDYIH